MIEVKGRELEDENLYASVSEETNKAIEACPFPPSS